MKDLRDFIIETSMPEQISESTLKEARDAWKALETSKLKEIVKKAWPEMQDYFESMFPFAEKYGIEPKVLAMYLIDTVDAEMIPEFEEMSVHDAAKDLQQYVSQLDADQLGMSLEDYIKNMDLDEMFTPETENAVDEAVEAKATAKAKEVEMETEETPAEETEPVEEKPAETETPEETQE